MNYKNIYRKLIHSTISNIRKKGDGNYYEYHHIIPRCVGGSDSKDNMVLLTAKEHYIAHHLLSKMFSGEESHKLKYGFDMMCRVRSGKQERDYNITSIVYETARKEFSKIHSERMKGRPTWNKGKTGIYTEESLKKMSDNSKGNIAWNRGKKNPYSKETLLKMSESSKGQIAWNKDNNVYEFYNEQLNRLFIGTREALKHIYEVPSNKISQLINGKKLYSHGWIFLNEHK